MHLLANEPSGVTSSARLVASVPQRTRVVVVQYTGVVDNMLEGLPDDQGEVDVQCWMSLSATVLPTLSAIARG